MPPAACALRPRAPPFIEPSGYAQHRPESTLLYHTADHENGPQSCDDEQRVAATHDDSEHKSSCAEKLVETNSLRVVFAEWGFHLIF